MTAAQAHDDESLLRRVRRIVVRAKTNPLSAEARRVRAVEAELRVLVAQLNTRAGSLNAELQAEVRRQDAMTAYRRCLSLGRRSSRQT